MVSCHPLRSLYRVSREEGRVQMQHQVSCPVFPQKHIKEHHEEVRERPCPHPGCNKVFMIDRYLQRHVKLIHTGTCLELGSRSLGWLSGIPRAQLEGRSAQVAHRAWYQVLLCDIGTLNPYTNWSSLCGVPTGSRVLLPTPCSLSNFSALIASGGTRLKSQH